MTEITNFEKELNLLWDGYLEFYLMFAKRLNVTNVPNHEARHQLHCLLTELNSYFRRLLELKKEEMLDRKENKNE